MANLLSRLFGRKEQKAVTPDLLPSMGRQDPQMQQFLQDQIQTYLRNNVATINNIVPVNAPFSETRAVNAYTDNSAVYTIVKLKISMEANIPFYPYKIKGGSDMKYFRAYKQLTSGPALSAEGLYKAAMLKVKAMEQIADTSPISQILLRPNDIDSQFEFLEKVYGFLNLCGEEFIWKQRLSMGANKGRTIGMYTLPSQYMKIVPDGRMPVGPGGYILDLNGEIGLQKDEVMHVKYFNPLADVNNCQLHGLSPIRAGQKPLKKNNAATDGEIASFENGGPPMIIFREDVRDLDPTQAGLLKQRFVNETSGVNNINKIMLSAGKLGAIQTGISPVDQKILESGQYSFKELCGLWSMPPGIFGSGNDTYENQAQYEKSAYTHGCIPDVIRVRDMYNKSLVPDFDSTGGIFIDADFSNISALQQDMKTTSEWLAASPEITYNERREIKMFERLPDPNMDKVYVSSGIVPLDQLNEVAHDLSNSFEDPLLFDQTT